jgi:DNA-binding response OmpR family regulator
MPQAVRRIRSAAPHTSIVLLSSADNEETAVQAIQEGAQDYLIKGLKVCARPRFASCKTKLRNFRRSRLLYRL